MRNAFSDAIVAAAKADPRVLLLTGDHGYALFDEFRRACPDQFVNCGVAEQNMVGVAAGLAKAGFKPIVYGLACFVPIRTLEQIKLDVCYEELPVVFIGDGAGLVYSSLGSSHQSAEDIAALRAVPNIDILSPCDVHEMRYAMAHALRFEGPVYIRMGKSDVGTVHAAPCAAPLGDLLPARAGGGTRGTAFIATGSMVRSAVDLAESLEDNPVWSAPSIKPLNAGQVEALAREFDQVVVLEEHNRLGGLGGAVAEIVAAMRGPRARVLRLGIDDRFSRFNGSWDYLRREHGIDPDALRAQVLQSASEGR
ncbi:transketolase family protein [Massilia sp. Root335]|jgi:transketolase|uniref:transketolase family protein n=1 Tax=Massilia sp. Root335 TaxID=1736517 RepID=UPI0006F5B024|nr:transketolase C-terminal domain-containing protein [Massilia sp. Root335]KQV51491.1 transketolase [Massilia sp. Root335]